MADPAEDEYILGTEEQEIARLRFQHRVWLKEAYAIWERAGIRAGDTVLDLGCGPGFTTFELASVVGNSGSVIARDESPRFLEYLSPERDRLGLTQIVTSLGPVEELDLPTDHLDAAYGRWLLCWVPDPGRVIERVAQSLKPGGALVFQDYLDWGAVKLLPASETFDRAVLACMASWDVPINIGERIPTLAEKHGLFVESFQPVARLGRVGSFEWRWIEQFFSGYLPKLVERDLYGADELEAFHREWRQRSAESASYCYTPTVVDVVLRK
jgi:SAM-dependent methyltransferase